MAKMRTYDEWIAKGRQVRRGERSIGRDDFGRAVFSKTQTDPIEPSSDGYDTDPTWGDWEDCH